MSMALEAEHARNRSVAYWLLGCTVLVFGMVVLGGVTRLTHSGLSMVDWRPIMGVIPPLTQESWQATFDQYKNFPEFQKTNIGMDLEGFKSIFWFEYAHRLLGRLIGFAFFLPMLFFIVKKHIQGALLYKCVGLLVLGGLQGLMGWYMVMSGLVDDPRVSQYRLTAHLALAVILYGIMLWMAFDLLKIGSRKSELDPGIPLPKGSRGALVISTLLFVMILTGGFVAGTRAGLLFGTFPLMGDVFFPEGLYAMQPFWLSAFVDTITIQFNHRMLAYLLIVSICWYTWRCLSLKQPSLVCGGVLLMLFLLFVQVSLGIATLILSVPVGLAAAHQGVALLLFGSSLFVTYLQRH